MTEELDFPMDRTIVKGLLDTRVQHTALLAALTALPKHLLWRLADCFQRYEHDTDANDAYVRWRDVEDLLREHREGR